MRFSGLTTTAPNRGKSGWVGAARSDAETGIVGCGAPRDFVPYADLCPSIAGFAQCEGFPYKRNGTTPLVSKTSQHTLAALDRGLGKPSQGQGAFTYQAPNNHR